MGLKDKLKFKKYLKKAQAGDARYQCYVGSRYKNGLGVEQNFNEAVKWYYEAAKNGNMYAFYCLGICYENGYGLLKDLKTALDCYIKAENDSGSDVATAEAIIRVAVATGEAKSPEYFNDRARTLYNKRAPGFVECAIIYYNKAAEMGSASAMNMLGYIHISDDFFFDPYKSYDWTLKAANKGNMDAQNRLGWVYEKGKCGKQQNMTEALRWYEKAAAQGHVEAKKAVARLKPTPAAKPATVTSPAPAVKTTPVVKPAPAVSAVSAEQSYKTGMSYYGKAQYAQAIGYLKQSADSGHSMAQYYLGNCYFNGYGVTKNLSESFKWYKKAALQNNGSSQFCVAKAYENGLGVDKNLSEAANWYKKAALNGKQEAQTKIGEFYLKGTGVTRDYAEAVKWFRKAVGQNDAQAKYYLGYCYEYGHGVAKNIPEALVLYREASSGWSEEARKAVARFEDLSKKYDIPFRVTEDDVKTYAVKGSQLKDLLNAKQVLGFEAMLTDHMQLHKMNPYAAVLLQSYGIEFNRAYSKTHDNTYFTKAVNKVEELFGRTFKIMIDNVKKRKN